MAWIWRAAPAIRTPQKARRIDHPMTPGRPCLMRMNRRGCARMMKTTSVAMGMGRVVVPAPVETNGVEDILNLKAVSCV